MRQKTLFNPITRKQIKVDISSFSKIELINIKNNFE